MRFSPLFALALATLASAQDPEVKTDNSRRPIVPWSLEGSSRAQARMDAPPTSHYWAAFSASLGEAEYARLAGLGVEMIGFAGRPGGYRLYRVRLAGDVAAATASLQAMPTFVNLLPLLPEEKTSRQVLNGQFRTRPAKGKAKATVRFYRNLPRTGIEGLLKGAVDVVEPGEDGMSAHVVASPGRLQALLDLDEVARVEDFQEQVPLLDRARVQTKVGALQYGVLDTLSFPPTPAWNRGVAYTGDSIWVCINETVQDSIRDFRETTQGGTTRRGTNRLSWHNNDADPSHGTLVAGIILGNGWNSEANGHGRYRMRGVAPKALFTAGNYDGDVTNTSKTNGIVGYYNSNDVVIDQQTSRHLGLSDKLGNVMVFAAANNGAGSDPANTGMQKGYYSMLINAKNAIKVASTRPDGTRASSSSMGPTRDGRLGPDVSAPGHEVASVASWQQGYSWGYGTSFAAPHVSGIAALMLQKYRDQVLRPRGAGANIHDQPPWNSTVRAILIHTATDLSENSSVGDPNPDYAANGYPGVATVYPAGPDFATGYGLVNAQKALQFTDTTLFREASVGQGQVRSYSITVPAGRPNLRVTLAWDDPEIWLNDEANAYANKLVNDLDLRLVSPSGQTYIVYAPDHSLYNNGTVPADGIDPVTPLDVYAPSGLPPVRDAVSNVEVRDVPNPAAGLWRIEVHGYDIGLDQSADAGVNQDFSLVSDIALPAAPAANGPDLVLTKLSTLPAAPVMGQPVHLLATLHNRGNQATPAVGHSVSFYAMGGTVDSFAVPALSLAPGQSLVVPTRIPYAIGNDRTNFAAWLDGPNVIAEASDQNNTVSLHNVEVGLPSPWIANEIGSAPAPGSSWMRGHRSFYVTTYGRGIGGTADEFLFTSRSLSGDGEIRARIGEMYGAGPAVKVGLMVRENTLPGSRYVMIAATQGQGGSFQRRTATNGATAATAATGSPNMHLRLVRTGNVFTAYWSFDGVSWNLAGSETLAIPSLARIGFAVAGSPDGNGIGILTEVAVTGGVGAALVGRVTDASGAGVAGATVTVSGCAELSATTDPSGSYSLSGLPMGGTCTLTPGHAYNAYVFHPPFLQLPAWDSNRQASFLATPASVPSPWATADIGSTGVVGIAGHNAGYFTLWGGGADIQGTADGFRSVHRTLSGDGEIRARVDGILASHPFAKAGVMMRNGMADNAANAFMALTNTQGATFQSRATAGGNTTYNLTGGIAAPHWVRLVRTGNVFTGYRSPDGAAWTQQGQVTLSLPASLNLGLAVTSHTLAARAGGAFSDVVVSSLGFAEADIGSVGAAGSRTASGDAHSVRGSGADIWGTSDAFHYSHLVLAGDGEIRARVASLQNTNAWAKAGVMIRETLAANARNFMVAVTPGQGVTFQRRLTAGGNSVYNAQAGLGTPQWVRLVRAGSVISAFTSFNGTAWTFLGQETVAMAANVYIGLAVTSHSNGTLCTAVFDRVSR